ncbi:MAG: hypothetical protein JWQ38_2757 [Flavipsychrobacter sp.]|nr:hypothetical protein [Flavipsychrobacter sp.]
MEYRKEALEQELAKLVGKQIAEVYYYDKYEFFESFTQLNDKMQGVMLKGILLKATDGAFFAINDTDYFPELALGGMTLAETTDASNPADRRNHINSKQWLKYHGNEITGSRVHEIQYVADGKTYTVPLGITLDFKDGAVLHIYNAFVEDYNAGTRKYELSRGESLTFFFDTESLKGYKELAHGLVVEVEDME